MIRQFMTKKILARIVTASLMLAAMLIAQSLRGQTARGDDPEARPPVSKADVQIVHRAREILNSQSNGTVPIQGSVRQMPRPSAFTALWKRLRMR